MAHKVFLTEQAHKDVDSACSWWAENRSAKQADRWYQKFVATIDLLRSRPECFAHAQENDNLSVELRQVNFGLGQRLTHRVVYTIRPDMVLVFRVLHLAQHDLSAEDL
ncbi:MAG: type II toxin-antitoxin system RelE/ParE family toxin [Planctomycetes bacterium]|nr:type II toxin-antitoxin system RelE/ParE family toxin [Planctomycetota bacterium]